MPTTNFSISNHFALWEAVSQTKYCCSHEDKIFGPSQNFLADYATDSRYCSSAVRATQKMLASHSLPNIAIVHMTFHYQHSAYNFSLLRRGYTTFYYLTYNSVHKFSLFNRVFITEVAKLRLFEPLHSALWAFRKIPYLFFIIYFYCKV